MPAVNIAPYIINQYFDDNGVKLAGGKIYTYAAGTDTLKSTYQDALGLTANANPIVLDAAGRFRMYLASGAYKIVVKTSAGVTVWTEDNVTANAVTVAVNTVDEMKNLPLGSQPFVRTLGRGAANDGGGWWYAWDGDSTATDDGGMVIQPAGLPAKGRFLGLIPSDRLVNLRIYGATMDGSTDDTAEVMACDDWCAANNCRIYIDDDVRMTTNPSLASYIVVANDATISYGSFDGAAILDRHVVRAGRLKVQYSGEGILLGADRGAYVQDTVTDSTQKDGIIAMPHYDTSEENVCILYGTSRDTDTILQIGGIGTHNSPTEVDIYCQSTPTATDAAIQMSIKSTGVTVGSPTGGYKGSGTINATAVYDDNVILTGYVLDKVFNPDFDLKKWDEVVLGTNMPARKFAARSAEMCDLDAYCRYIEKNRVLPTFDDIEAAKATPSTGMLAQRLWEVVEVMAVHIWQLHERLRKIELKEEEY